eukprot:1028423-Pelagomonas_calceolata.AAC.1
MCMLVFEQCKAYTKLTRHSHITLICCVTHFLRGLQLRDECSRAGAANPTAGRLAAGRGAAWRWEKADDAAAGAGDAKPAARCCTRLRIIVLIYFWVTESIVGDKTNHQIVHLSTDEIAIQ